MQFSKLSDAQAEMKRRGFKLFSKTTNSEYKREYYVFADGRKNVFLDHSATITCTRSGCTISDFSKREG